MSWQRTGSPKFQDLWTHVAQQISKPTGHGTRVAVTEAAAVATATTVQPFAGGGRSTCARAGCFRVSSFSPALRDVTVRYKQTVLGVAWVLLQPLLAMGIFSIVFGQRGSPPQRRTRCRRRGSAVFYPTRQAVRSGTHRRQHAVDQQSRFPETSPSPPRCWRIWST